MTNSNKAIDSLEHLVEKYFIDNEDKELSIIVKHLRALQIIKEKRVYTQQLLMYKNNYKFYNMEMTDNRKLTEEEFNIVREVLLDD